MVPTERVEGGIERVYILHSGIGASSGLVER